MFDVITMFDKVIQEKPKVAMTMGMTLLGIFSPFNSHLKAKLEKWDQHVCRIRVRNHRGVRNHLGSVHAGALFTLGETCAGLLILKNFAFKKYRLIMKNASVEYEKQARSTVFGEATMSVATIQKTMKGLETGEPQMVDFKTTITNDKGEVCAVVTTTWQIKSWDQVRNKTKST